MWCSTLRICPDTYLEPHLSLESKPPEGLELANTLRTLSLGKPGRGVGRAELGFKSGPWHLLRALYKSLVSMTSSTHRSQYHLTAPL